MYQTSRRLMVPFKTLISTNIHSPLIDIINFSVAPACILFLVHTYHKLTIFKMVMVYKINLHNEFSQIVIRNNLLMIVEVAKTLINRQND